ncbi:MAG: DUF1476 domain-containing protein [Alphaproteobacteria bacterium]|nr:DUF1476 domain-containing protein [Alphaproteobacteria bacterium]
MTTFDKREAAEENKFALDAELQFKARARRDRLVGAWAAEKLGLSGQAAADYAASIVTTDLQEHGDGDVIRKLKADFAAKNVAVSDHQIERTLAEKMAEAAKDLKVKG